ncbi:hypothetical protein ACTNE3_11560 [Bacillota bacterium HCP3S3_F1_1]
MAISIPIFTGQLNKARLATNRANARAAYAAVETQYLQGDTKTGDVSYDVATGKISTTATAGTVTMAGTDISAWTVDQNSLGTTTYKVWILTVDDTGSVTTHKAGPANS